MIKFYFLLCAVFAFTTLVNATNYDDKVSTAVDLNNTKNESVLSQPLVEENYNSTTNLTTVANVAQVARNSFITGHQYESSSLLSADDQCKLMHGKQAQFCRGKVDNVCQSLSCRLSVNSSCLDGSIGAKEGTLCGSGKICMQGQCVESDRAPYGECLFGDDLVMQDAIGMSLPTPQMTCEAVLKYVDSLNQSPTAYCSNSNFRQICCQTCKKYDKLECTDKYFDCPRYSKVCKTSSINGVSLNILCPRTCRRCPVKPLQCSYERELCQNGATCVNLTVPDDSLFGFRCHCTLGYYGELCDKKNSCLPNPCQTHEICESYGSIAYKCIQKVDYFTTTKTFVKLESGQFQTTTRPSSRVSNQPKVSFFPTLSSTSTRTSTIAQKITTFASTTATTTTTTSTKTTTSSTTTTTTSTTTTTTSTTTTTLTTTTTSPATTTTTTTTHKVSTESSTRQTQLAANSTSTEENSSPESKIVLKNYHYFEVKNDANCVNVNDEICNYYASQNLCDPFYYLNGHSITVECRKACNKC